MAWDTDPVLRCNPGEKNAYIAHRLAFPTRDGQAVECDCGKPFQTMVELEQHQHPYRHPGLGIPELSAYERDWEAKRARGWR